MKRNELNLIVSSSVFLAVIIGILYLWIAQEPVIPKNGFKALSFGVTCITFFWGIYFNWGWKWHLLRKIFYRPNINGTWAGELISDWKNKEGNGIGPRKFFIVIRQNFIKINFTTYTDSFIGRSYSETFTLNKGRGIKNVTYLYRKETSCFLDEIMSEGATELRLIESNIFRMEGKFWSSIKTNGSIKIEQISNTQVDSYEDAVLLETTKSKK